ncbi:formate dehydrogenase subunit delta [Ornithinimicrobium cerasi]|uniref:formate dehydrogenase subunit delta n=1 Tax=Ornithinimicrobium cerasi TaxID=2248773 RepID=UPI000F006DA2|nr:formate dehydrogenase subunit delta [Ornithinimicrobium cerasi]
MSAAGVEEGHDPRELLSPEVRLGGDIARALAHLGEDAPTEIATHLRKFWDPRMRAAILERLRAGEIEDPLLRAGVEAYLEGEVDRGEVREPSGG